MRNQSATVIDKGKKIGLAQFALLCDPGTVKSITLPDLIGQLRLKTPAILCYRFFLHKPVLTKKPVKGCRRHSKVCWKKFSHFGVTKDGRNRGSLKLLLQVDKSLHCLLIHDFDLLMMFSNILTQRPRTRHRKNQVGCNLRAQNLTLNAMSCRNDPLA